MEGSGDLLLFLGRFHPLFLHLPIGFLVMAVLLEFVSKNEKYRALQPAVGFTLFIGAISALVAAILGLMLAQDGGYSEDLLNIHQWLGIALVGFAFGAWWLQQQHEKKGTDKLKRAYFGSLVLMMVFLGGAGHFGGSLTHGSNYLTQNMPNSLRALVGLEQSKGPKLITNLQEAEVFGDIVHPILEMRCNSCHNASKKKGDLQMHTMQAMQRGGESGAAIVAGDPAQSLLLQRIHLPETDEEHMPPKGKTQLTDQQVALLEWWIAEGAPFDKKVAEVKVDGSIDEILQTLVDPNANKSEVEILLASEPPVPNAEKIRQFRDQGVMIKTLAANSSWLQVTIDKKLPVEELLAGLVESFPEQITWLDLKESDISDAGLEPVAKLKNLTKLRLEKTSVSDAGLEYLKGLTYLEFLNIYGSQVGDQGIAKLSDLRNLRSLYAWETRVTEAGANQLESQLSKLTVNLGFEVNVVDSLTVEVLPVGSKLP